MANRRIEVVEGDITTLDVEMVVNAANKGLAGGGGVDGAIHRAAGAAELREACRKLGGCSTGDAKLTPGFGLRAKWIAHAVGPVWQGGRSGERELLASCYRRALELASEVRARSAAFPAISTGVYRYPISQAAEVAVETVQGFLADHDEPERVILCAYDTRSADKLREALEGR